MRRNTIRCATLALVSLTMPGIAQTDRSAAITLDLAAGAVTRVKDMYFATDYARGVDEADKLLKQFPKSRELAAWRAANLARSERPSEARAAAKALLDANRNDPWGWFAQTLYLEYAGINYDAKPVLDASAEAYKRAPNHPSIGWLRAMALSAESGPRQALTLIDSIAQRGPLPVEMKNLRANALYNVATANPRKVDQALVDSALALYAEVRRTHPEDVAAHSFPGSRMLNLGRQMEAHALLKKATELAPTSVSAHQYYWSAIDGLKDRPQAERDAEALADVEMLLKARVDDPSVLSAAAGQYRARRQPERATALENRLLTVAPTSMSAEWTLVTRYRAMRKDVFDTTVKDPSLKPRYTQALWSFINRPTHESERMLGDAYRELFYLADSTTHPDTLVRIVRGMVQYEGINPHVVYADGAIKLADRGRDFREAERIAREGLKAGKARIDRQKEIYETLGDYARAVDWMSAFMYDALGVVFMREGKLDEAERQLKHARELDPNSMKATFHLGELAERRGKLDEAEQLYAKGSLLSSIASNPNRAALRAVYAKKRGSLDGYDAFVAGLADVDRANRKAAIAKSRADKPTPLREFSLKTLEGEAVSPASLRGKTAVINNWGMWCGPCVAEMPEFQKLATKFASDSTVKILTIDNDPNTDELRAWMAKKGYTFTTLIDDGYLKRSGINSYPTTWFVDPSGRIVFTKTGWSEQLVEEFIWRIEMIKSGSAIP
jgi:tetratricopeptide (TPR) repeat protein/peroxiredoxin